MRGLLSILSFFHNEFETFNNTGARILDYIYHMKLKLFCMHVSVVKMNPVCQIYGRSFIALPNYKSNDKNELKEKLHLLRGIASISAI